VRAIPDGVKRRPCRVHVGRRDLRFKDFGWRKVSLGENVLVIGLGLVGQICVALLKAQGCHVFGTDVDPGKLALARELGADRAELGSPADAVNAFSGGAGVDAVLIAAATSSNEPIEFAAQAWPPEGPIVLVGRRRTERPRPPFFEKELEFTVSSSLGPGRNDPDTKRRGSTIRSGMRAGRPSATCRRSST